MFTPKKLARIAGLLYLIVIASGLFAEVFVRQKLFISGNAMATAQNIQSQEMLYRLGFVADLINFVIGLPVVLIVYLLLKHVNKPLALLALFFVIVQTAVIAVNLSNQLSPLLLLTGEQYSNSFQPNQLAALSVHALHLQTQGYAIGLVFFGFYCIIIGMLIFHSSIIPRVLGVLYAAAGAAYLVNSFTMFLSYKFANPVFPYIAAVAFIGEFSFTMWLLIKGVKDNGQK